MPIHARRVPALGCLERSDERRLHFGCRKVRDGSHDAGSGGRVVVQLQLLTPGCVKRDLRSIGYDGNCRQKCQPARAGVCFGFASRKGCCVLKGGQVECLRRARHVGWVPHNQGPSKENCQG